MERPYIMKKYLAMSLFITTDIPEKTHSTGTFHYSNKSDNLTLYYPCPRTKFEKHLDFECHVTWRNQSPSSRQMKKEDSGNEVGQIEKTGTEDLGIRLSADHYNNPLPRNRSH